MTENELEKHCFRILTYEKNMERVVVYLQECHNLLFCCDRTFVTYYYNDGDDRHRELGRVKE